MEPFENEADESERQVDNTAFVQETENTALSDASPIQEKQGDVEPDTTELDPQINEQDDDQIEPVVNGQDKPADQGATEFDTVDDDDAEDDDEDDVVNVIIKPSNQGSIYKTGTAYQARSHVLHPQIPKPTRQGVNLGDPGNIQGVPTIDFNLTTLGDEEKPWKRPGADITDYFNYGFTEETWTQYCEKQKIIRQEYANSTIKPLLVGTAAGLGFNGLTLAQRNRFVGLPSRSFDSYKSAANINVINLSSSNARSGVGLLSPTRDMDSDEDETKSNLGVSDGSIAFGGSSLGPGFSMPPPGYSADQSAALAQLNTAAAAAAVNAFNLPPPVFGNTAAAASGVFPNTAVPPPAMSSNLFAHQQQQSAWPPSSVSNGLISLLAGSGVRHAGLSGRMTSDNRGQTPEDLFSDDEYQDSRRRRHNAEEETDDRDQYRSSRRSRSRSRERRYSSRSKRHHEESSSRDYSRHGEHRSHRRSRDHHHSRSERNSLAVSGSVSGDYPGEGGGSSSRRSRERSSVRRDSRRSDRESRDPGSISRSSRRQRMTSRSPDRIISYKRGRSPLSRSNSPHLMRQSSSPTAQKQPPIDPLTAAAAAAADIAARLSRVDNEHMFG